MTYTFTPLSTRHVDARVREALAENGFGVLTELDVKSTLKAKIDAEIGAYRILGDSPVDL